MVLLCFGLNLKICRLRADGLRQAAGDPEILWDLVEQPAERKDFPPYAGLAMLIARRLERAHRLAWLPAPGKELPPATRPPEALFYLFRSSPMA